MVASQELCFSKTKQENAVSDKKYRTMLIADFLWSQLEEMDSEWIFLNKTVS